MDDPLRQHLPQLAAALPRLPIAALPTPLQEIPWGGIAARPILVKRDDLSQALYGGNKVRKLEFLLARARLRDATRVATFGTVASNHALATALYARELGFDSTCLLSHQTRTEKAAIALNMHLENHTEIVRYGGVRSHRVAVMRKHLQRRRCWVIPMGGSNWLGVVGFVNAALELAAQLDAQRLPVPTRIYVANGTMGTAAGLALGLALAKLPTEVHAVRVTHEFIANPQAMQRLIIKTATLMRRYDASVPGDLAGRCKLRFRNQFFGDGYAHSTPAAERAIAVAATQLGLKLDSTYAGKAMAAVLHDLQDPALADQPVMFWNTYNSRPLPVSADRPADVTGLPAEFLRYYEPSDR